MSVTACDRENFNTDAVRKIVNARVPEPIEDFWDQYLDWEDRRFLRLSELMTVFKY